MRFIVLDEAGILPEDRATVVAGVIVHADGIIRAESKIAEVLGAVPPEFRDPSGKKEFWFSSKDIWNEKIYKSWVMADRLALMRNMMRIPRSLRMAICLGMCNRGGTSVSGFTPLQSDHIRAFIQCVSRADKWIREKTPGMEAATLVVEDTESMNYALNNAIDGLRGPLKFKPSPELVQRTAAEQVAGYIQQEQDTRITRIRHSVHFAKKRTDPLLQLADAMAFGFRRYFEGQEHGDTFINAILGSAPERQDFTARTNGYTWGPEEVRMMVLQVFGDGEERQ